MEQLVPTIEKDAVAADATKSWRLDVKE